MQAAHEAYSIQFVPWSSHWLYIRRESIRITVRLFAAMAQDAGLDRLELSVAEGCAVGAAIEELRKAYPRMRWPAGSLIALNQEYVGMDCVLRAGDEMAIIPPVSGGGRGW